MLLKVKEPENVKLATISILKISLNFNILFVMVVLI